MNKFLTFELFSTQDCLDLKPQIAGLPSPKKRRVSFPEDDDVTPSLTVGSASLKENVLPTSFHPLHLISTWTEPDSTNQCVTVAVVLPSGVGSGGFSVRVLENGRELELVVRMPKQLQDMKLLHRKWLRSTRYDRMEPYHPKIVGFQNALKELRQHTEDFVESTARIALPISVQTHIFAKYNMSWRDDTTKLLYLDLKAPVENYGILQDDNSFELT